MRHKFSENDAIPRNDLTSKHVSGTLKRKISWTLPNSGLIPSPDKMCPKNVTLSWINWHFPEFTNRPNSAIFKKLFSNAPNYFQYHMKILCYHHSRFRKIPYSPLKLKTLLLSKRTMHHVDQKTSRPTETFSQQQRKQSYVCLLVLKVYDNIPPSNPKQKNFTSFHPFK